MNGIHYIIVLCTVTIKKLKKYFTRDDSFYYYNNRRLTLKKLCKPLERIYLTLNFKILKYAKNNN